jgi:hypothetical protein
MDLDFHRTDSHDRELLLAMSNLGVKWEPDYRIGPGRHRARAPRTSVWAK